jgi:hypothetical protein
MDSGRDGCDSGAYTFGYEPHGSAISGNRSQIDGAGALLGKDAAEIARAAIEQTLDLDETASRVKSPDEVNAALVRWKQHHQNGIAIIDDSRESISEGRGW